MPPSSLSGFETYDTANVYVDDAYGAYYTWFAATAGTGTSSLKGAEAPSSIAPKGWKLPSKNDHSTLLDKQGTNLTEEPTKCLKGGECIKGSLTGQSKTGHYWSSTAIASSEHNQANYLQVKSVSSLNSTDKYFGFSVRCLARME